MTVDGQSEGDDGGSDSRTAVNAASSTPPQRAVAKASVFTIISLNYGAFARTLMDRLRTTHPDWDRYVLVVDRSDTPTDIGGELFSTVMVEISAAAKEGVPVPLRGSWS